MHSRLRPSPAMVIALIALFVSLGGTAAALSGSNTVFTDDIVNNQVRSDDVRNDTLGGGGLAAVDLRPNSVGASEVINGALETAEFGTLPAVRAGNSADQSVPDSTPTDLTLDTERFDTDGMHSTSSNTERLTAPIAGTYVISSNVSWAGNVTGTRTVAINRNGTADIAEESHAGFAAGPVDSIATVTRLSAGDYVIQRVSQTSGGALNVGGAGAQEFSPEFAMAWIGP